jgi:hypothetical protein
MQEALVFLRTEHCSEKIGNRWLAYHNGIHCSSHSVYFREQYNQKYTRKRPANTAERQQYPESEFQSDFGNTTFLQRSNATTSGYAEVQDVIGGTGLLRYDDRATEWLYYSSSSSSSTTRLRFVRLLGTISSSSSSSLPPLFLLGLAMMPSSGSSSSSTISGSSSLAAIKSSSSS